MEPTTAEATETEAPTAAPAPRGPHGRMTGMAGNLIRGWAFDPADPDARLVVEVLLDGYATTIAQADLFDPDLRDLGLGDGCHGFAVSVPEGLLARTASITARIANTGIILAGQIRPWDDSPGESALPTVFGQVFHGAGLRLTGWAWDRVEPDRHVEIRVHEGGDLVCLFRADRLRADLAQKKVGAGDHAFDEFLPARLADGKPHELRILDDQGRELSGSPLTLILHPTGASALAEAIAKGAAPGFLGAVARQLRAYESVLPAGMGFADYAAWYQAFGKPPATAGADASEERVLVLVHGKGDPRRTLESLQAQGHSRWDARVAGEGDPGPADPRVRRCAPGGWSEALAEARQGGWAFVTLVRAGDRLPPHALSRAVSAFADPAVQVVYSDCDQDGPDGGRTNPWFKPDWDPDLFLSQDYAHQLFVARTALLPSAGPLDDPLDLIYHAIARVPDGAAIRHLPEVLYHRQPGPEGDGSPDEDRSIAALTRHLARVEPEARVERLPGHPGLRRIRRPLRARPRVSLIIPTRDQLALLRPCIDSILERSTYRDFEILIVDNQSMEPQTLDWLAAIAAHPQVRVLPYPRPFNYSAINNMAVEEAAGEVVGLVNNDIEVISPDWLEEMLALLLRPGVGAAGAKLLWPNGMVQHGGVVLGVGGLAAHACNDLMQDEPGYMGRGLVTQRYSAVTAACLLCRKQDYLAVGGLDQAAFPVAFNDVDLCLKLGRRGLGVVWTPFALLYHKESASRGKEDTPEKAARAYKEASALRRRWAPVLADDPHYSPNLSLDGQVFSGLSLPPRRAQNH